MLLFHSRQVNNDVLSQVGLNIKKTVDQAILGKFNFPQVAEVQPLNFPQVALLNQATPTVKCSHSVHWLETSMKKSSGM